MSRTEKTLKRILAMALSLLTLFAMLPLNLVYALGESTSEIATNLASIDFNVNQATEFTVTSTANGDAGKMVTGSLVFSDPSAITSLAYLLRFHSIQAWL